MEKDGTKNTTKNRTKNGTKKQSGLNTELWQKMLFLPPLAPPSTPNERSATCLTRRTKRDTSNWKE